MKATQVLYDDVVREFASSGAKLIQQSIAERYRGLVPVGTRLIEPGYIPTSLPPRVLIVSYYPNESDLDKPGTPPHKVIRDHLEAWGRSGSVEAYGASYADWLGYLNRVPFHRQRTKPILEAVGLANQDIGWLPFVKAPMPAGTSPDDDVIDIDRDATWNQLQLIQPAILWIQGIKIAKRVTELVRGRITDRILPPQSVSQYDNTAKQTDERTRIIAKLTSYLEETS